MTTTWQEAERDERVALDQLGPTLANQLGTDWKSERPEGHWGFYLTNPGSEATPQLFVSFDRGAALDHRRDRVIVRGVYPREARDRYRYDSESNHQRRAVQNWEISVAVKRGIDVIAKEIKRRLLPGYQADLAAVVGWQRQHEVSHAKARANADLLAETLGGASINDDPNGSISVHWYGGEKGYADFRVSEGSVYIDRLSFPVEKLQRVAEVLAQ